MCKAFWDSTGLQFKREESLFLVLELKETLMVSENVCTKYHLLFCLSRPEEE